MHSVHARAALAALAWLITMWLLAGWGDTTAALETALFTTVAAGLIGAAPDWRHPDPRRPRTPVRWALGVTVGMMAVGAIVVGLVDLAYAMMFASGYEHIPSNTGERILWLLIPLIAAGAGGWALREGSRYPTLRWRPKRYLAALLASLGAGGAWWVLAAALTR